MPYLRVPAAQKRDHSFLAEELLMPNTDKVDLSRTNMFCSHIVQALVLNEAERPLVFTGFENQVGRYASSFKAFDADMRLVARVQRNAMNDTLVFQEVESGCVHIVERRSHERTTESYGYSIDNSVLDGIQLGEVIDAGSVVARSPTHDEDMNMAYGVNLETVFATMHGLNYEDGILISRSAAEKLNYEVVEEIIVTINNNDVLVNLYGNNTEYRGFPEVGEEIGDGILCSRRRISYDSAFVELNNRALRQINFAGDTVFYGKGTVVDVRVCSNISPEAADEHPYNQQMVRYLRSEIEYCRELVSVLEPLIEGKECGPDFTPDVSYIYGRAKAACDPDSRWSYEKSEFDGMVLKITVAHREHVAVGSKITNRYGGKGVISKILEDEEMPTTEGGKRADVVFSCLGIVNRLNPASLYEQELNAMAARVAESCYALPAREAYERVVDFIGDVNPRQGEQFRLMLDGVDESTRNAAVAEMLEGGIPLHQPPFFGNITLGGLRELYRKYGYGPERMVGIETPMIVGKVYYMVLKHHPKSKFSARSARYISIKEVPAKNNRDYKTGTSMYSTTPVRIGEQELTNLFLLKNPEETYRFIRQTSSSRNDRESLIRALLTEDPFALENLDPGEASESHTMAILNAYLTTMGLKIERNDG